MDTPTAALLIIGNEILSGRTQDKNLSYIAEKLNTVGIPLCEVRVVRDDKAAIINAIQALSASYTYLFTTGGIGPTHDDITTECVAAAFARPVIRHPDAETALIQHYKPDQINAARLKMADVPEGAALIANPVSAAPGYQIENVYVMAGVPRIMQAMLDGIMSQLQGGDPVHSHTIVVTAGEGDIAEPLAQLQATFPDVEMGSYPHFQHGHISVSVVLRSTDKQRLALAAAAVEHTLCTGQFSLKT